MKDRGQFEFELVVGSKGVFDVYHDGTLIYSKFAHGRFPEHDEIVRAIQA